MPSYIPNTLTASYHSGTISPSGLSQPYDLTAPYDLHTTHIVRTASSGSVILVEI